MTSGGPHTLAHPAREASEQVVLAIYHNTLAHAVLEDDDWIVSGDGTVQWILAVGEITKAKAIRQFLSNIDAGYLRLCDVDCRVEWLQIDRDAIFEAAKLEAVDYDPPPKQLPILKTWEEEGWAWTPCPRGTYGARRFYRCEVKANAPV